jgi:signal transduction histidine kinase
VNVAEVTQLAGELAASRHVATLVARGAPSAELFDAATAEVGRALAVDGAHLDRYEADGTVTVLAAWSEAGDHRPPVGGRGIVGGRNLSALVLQTGTPARIDDYGAASGPTAVAAREAGHRSGVATPIIVDGRLWGAMCVVAIGEEPLPSDTESRLAALTELLATAIASAESRTDLTRLAAEQTALRRVATLAAGGVPAQELFEAVTEEVGSLLPVDFAGMGRYEADGTVTFLTSWTQAGPGDFSVPSHWVLGGKNLSTIVAQTGRPARLDGDVDATGPIGEALCGIGFRSGVGTPVIVEGRLWGVIVAGSTLGKALPPETEARLGSFTKLVATAIASADSRGGLSRLAAEQAALRRVATLVARAASRDELFSAVTTEVGHLFPVGSASLGQYHSDGTVRILASFSPAGSDLSSPARVQIGSRIIVEGRAWGLISVESTLEDTTATDAEARLADFADLLASAIANADIRARLAGIAEEQAALRRVATLVARGVPPQELFAAVTKEVAQLLGVERAAMCRYEPDCAVAFVAGWDCCGADFPAVGRKWPIEEQEIAMLVARTVRPARIEGFRGESRPDSNHDGTGDGSVDSLVGTPIVVDGQLWGVITVAVPVGDPLPPDTEARLAAFTDLLGTAIANADSRAELAASRARIVAAADRERRRIERDLHDGAQQRLVGLGLQLRAAQAAMPPGLDELHGELEQVAQGLTRVQDGLREMARGIHPAILAHGGLGPVLKTLARRSPLPVKFDIRGLARLPEQVEVAAYYVVSEALANAAKHAFASAVQVEVEQVDGVLRVGVRDDGAGGADPNRGSGLVGLKDRVETLGGRISVISPLEAGTSLEVEIPVGVEIPLGG